MSYTNKTISQHIDFLADAFLIEKAQRYDIKGRKYIGANLKYYFTDLGLRNARLNFRQQEPTHIMENIVYMSCAFAVIMSMWASWKRSAGTAAASAAQAARSRFRRQSGESAILYPGCYDLTSEEKQAQESTRSAISRTRSRKSSS